MKILVVGNTKIDRLNQDERIDTVGIAQVSPFIRYHAQIKRLLGATVTTAVAETPEEILTKCISTEADIFFIRPPWSLKPESLISTFIQIREKHHNKKVVFIDPFDQTSSKYFGVLPYVDLFLKYQRLKSLHLYKKNFAAGTMYSDYYSTKWSLDTENWTITSPISDQHIHKIMTGWNLGENKDFYRALQLSTILPFRHLIKNIDVCCRIRIRENQTNTYYGKQRCLAIEALEPLRAKYEIAASLDFVENSKISRKQYKSEFRRSRISLSPFGWGEQTWRDFESIYFNSLIIKPSMEYIDTYPNIYIPDETYVPIKWDFSDLPEKCAYYLENPTEASRIIRNARKIYLNYFREYGFIEKLKELIACLETPIVEPLSKVGS